jgi:hypothetical protein
MLRIGLRSQATSACPFSTADIRPLLGRMMVRPPGGLPAIRQMILSLSDSVEESRERLLRWIAARCAIAGVEPRPSGTRLTASGRRGL